MGHDTADAAKAPQDLGTDALCDKPITGAERALGTFPLERISSLILRFLNRLKVTGKSPHTIAAYRNDLGLFARFLRDLGIDPTHAGHPSAPLDQMWAGFLESQGRASAASRRRAQMSIRTFLRFLVEGEVIQGSPLLCTKSPEQPAGSLFAVTPQHFRKLCNHLERQHKSGDSKALRDLALVLVLGRAGLKASEAATLAWRDVHLPELAGDRSAPRATLVVRSEERPRLIPLDPFCQKILQEHLRTSLAQTTCESPEQQQESSVFFGYQNMTRRPSPKAMQRHSVKFIIHELCQDTLTINYNAESFRNHAILCWLAKGLSSERVAKLAGYASLQSLERFLTPASTLQDFRRKPLHGQGTPTHERETSHQDNRSLRDP